MSILSRGSSVCRWMYVPQYVQSDAPFWDFYLVNQICSLLHLPYNSFQNKYNRMSTFNSQMSKLFDTKLYLLLTNAQLLSNT